MSDTFLKAPGATLDWSRDWGSWLKSGETISTSVWEVSPAGLTVAGTGLTGAIPTAWLTGGTVGVTYAVKNRITTSQGRTDERTFTVKVVDR